MIHQNKAIMLCDFTLQVIMASGSTSSLLGRSDEAFNGTKLMRLILDGGTEALRNIFRTLHPGNLQVVLSTNKRVLSNLRSRKIINQNQWDKLYPVHPNQPNIKDFDITLLSVLLRSTCSLSPPCSGWDKMRVVKEWNECDNKIVKALEENRKVLNDVKTLVEQGKESRSDDVLNKLLVCFDFQREIELYDGKFTRGTREWVFEQISTWFNNETSKNRAFIICALAGMGKSVIAAVICKRFAEYIGASHFFEYNNSQYNNPNFFLQSLAWHLSKVIPAYREALIKKLSGNLGKSLNDMNIEGCLPLFLKNHFQVFLILESVY
jgi:hypothetical protein